MSSSSITNFLKKYVSLRNSGKPVELEVRIFDGFERFGVSEDNFEDLLSIPFLDKTLSENVETLSFTHFKKRFEVDLEDRSKVEVLKKDRIAINDDLRRNMGVRIAISSEDREAEGVLPDSISFYRYKIRTSKVSSKKLPNWRFDFTKVYQVSLPEDVPLRDILDQKYDLDANAQLSYEIEVEHISEENESVEEIQKGLDVVLEIIEETIELSPILEIESLLSIKKPLENIRNIANQVVSLKMDDIHTILENYSVSEKADGERVLVYSDSRGNLYELSSPLVLTPIPKKTLKIKKKRTLLDAEKISAENGSEGSSSGKKGNGSDRSGSVYAFFDVLLYDSEDVRDAPFVERYGLVKSVVPKKNLKEFFFDGVDFKGSEILEVSKKVYQKKRPYYVDGLIYTPNGATYSNHDTFKWKPPKDLTLDLLIRQSPNNTVLAKGETFKIVELYFLIDIRHWIKHYKPDRNDSEKIAKVKKKANALASERFGLNMRKLPEFFPYPFIPDMSMKTFYAKLKATELDVSGMDLGESFDFGSIFVVDGAEPIIPIVDGMVIEFSYLKGTGWQPYRFRGDKTASYISGLAEGRFVPGPNGWRAVMGNWELIKNPVTEDLIFGEVPLPKKYYKRTATGNNGGNKSLARNMYKFNNYVKRSLYKDVLVSPKMTVLEIAGGRGGDLDKAFMNGASEVFLVDIDSEALKEAQRRFNEGRFSGKRKFETLEMDLNSEKLDLDREFDVVSCQFAFHYFLGSLKSLKHISAIVDSHLKPGGTFLFTGLDGKTVFNLLKDEKIVSFTKDEDAVIASIEKLYPESNKRLKSYGQEIDVFIEKIGIAHKEFLFNFENVIKHFEKKGYELVRSELFGETMLDNYRYKDRLSQAEQDYASINRFAVMRKPDN